MGTETDIRAALVKASEDGRLTTFKLPSSRGLCLTIERHTIDEGMDAWLALPGPERKSAFWSVQKALKRGIERIEKRTASQAESDGLAADAALWLAHELLYGDGERHLMKNPKSMTFAQ